MAVTIPIIGLRLDPPSKASAAYYAALGTMAALEMIEWPIAIVVATGHAIASNTTNPEVAQAVEGAEAGL